MLHPPLTLGGLNPLKNSRDFAGDGLLVEKAMHSNTPQDPLSDALHRWRINPARNRNFRDAVWQRIEDNARVTWSGYVRGHLVGWSVTAAMALLAAGWGGHAMAQARLDADRNAMVVSYLSGLDPRVLARLQP
jgi:hypothetical protein